VEAFLLTGGFTFGSPSTASASPAKPTFGEVKFYLSQTSAGAASGPAVTSVPTTTNTIYAYFTYKNMPKSGGATWAYTWALDGTDLPAASKSAQRWVKEGSGTMFVRLNDDKGLKNGDYDLSILLNDQEVQTASIHVGP